MCPECGRENRQFELLKGRWTRERGGTPWTREDWEVWKDPDFKPKPPAPPPNIIVKSWFKELLMKFRIKI